MSSRARLQPLDPEVVGKLPCQRCARRPMKLPAPTSAKVIGMCIGCYSDTRIAQIQRAANTGTPTPACFVGDPCLGCGSDDVDADGSYFWCNGCGMQVTIAS
ncbi:hypothetical protein ABT160_18655 [Streptomyces sp. NPDC001941]|uniref:hypothetical protein n=1 Tax=Streptomyces sp. NPDC001941 TaxID=3154659 RepID=UPI00332B7298